MLNGSGFAGVKCFTVFVSVVVVVVTFCIILSNFPTRGPLVRLNERGASKFGRTSLVI